MPDPRVVVLRKEVAAMARDRDRSDLFEAARAVETAATAALAPRGIHINVNFYGALLFHLLGADPQLVPCLMAVGRMAGTTALVREALATIRLYRPLSNYVGLPEREIPGRRPVIGNGRLPSEQSYGRGLEGLVAGDTAIAEIDGTYGRLLYRGYPIEDLSGA